MSKNSQTPNKKTARFCDPETVAAFKEVVEELQPMIDDGSIWHLEGRWGRMAIEGINRGLLRLGPQAFLDAYGNRVPAFFELEPGAPGSMEHYEGFWIRVCPDGAPL